MTELEAKLYGMLMQRFKVLAPMRGVDMTQQQMHQMSIDLAIMTARVLVDDRSTNYQGKKA